MHAYMDVSMRCLAQRTTQAQAMPGQLGTHKRVGSCPVLFRSLGLPSLLLLGSCASLQLVQEVQRLVCVGWVQGVRTQVDVFDIL